MRYNDTIYYGSDQRVSSGDNLITDTYPKWLKKTGWFIASAGHMRSDILIRENLVIKRTDTAVQIMEKIKKLHLKDGFRYDNSDGPLTTAEDYILIEIKTKRIYHCSSCYSPLELRNKKFFCIGAGFKYSTGYLEALFSDESLIEKLTPQVVIERAINCASKYDLACGGIPFTGEIK